MLGSRVESETLSGIVNKFNRRPRRLLLTDLPSLRLASSFASIYLKGLASGRSAVFQYREHSVVFARRRAARPLSFCCRCCLLVALDPIVGVL